MFGTVASRFNDDGVTALYQHLRGRARRARARRSTTGALAPVDAEDVDAASASIVPPARAALPGRDRRDGARLPRRAPTQQARAARRRQQLVGDRASCSRSAARPPATTSSARAGDARTQSTDESVALLDAWPAQRRPSCAARSPGARVAVGHAGARGSRCPASTTTASCSASCAARTCPGASRSPPACSRSSARTRTRPGCSPARAAPAARTAGSTCSPRASRRPGCRPRSTRSRSTASTPTSGPTSTARSATPACRSPRSTT